MYQMAFLGKIDIYDVKNRLIRKLLMFKLDHAMCHAFS